jgi:hypothetical protein
MARSKDARPEASKPGKKPLSPEEREKQKIDKKLAKKGIKEPKAPTWKETNFFPWYVWVIGSALTMGIFLSILALNLLWWGVKAAYHAATKDKKQKTYDDAYKAEKAAIDAADAERVRRAEAAREAAGPEARPEVDKKPKLAMGEPSAVLDVPGIETFLV